MENKKKVIKIPKELIPKPLTKEEELDFKNWLVKERNEFYLLTKGESPPKEYM